MEKQLKIFSKSGRPRQRIVPYCRSSHRSSATKMTTKRLSTMSCIATTHQQAKRKENLPIRALRQQPLPAADSDGEERSRRSKLHLLSGAQQPIQLSQNFKWRQPTEMGSDSLKTTQSQKAKSAYLSNRARRKPFRRASIAVSPGRMNHLGYLITGRHVTAPVPFHSTVTRA